MTDPRHEVAAAASLNRRVYVLYPRGVRTGGPEALHQLVHTLRALGLEAALVPIAGTEGVARHPAYAHYDAPEVADIDDSPDAIAIGPEVALRTLLNLKSAEAFCWWLSIDFARPWRDIRGRHDLWAPDGRLAKPGVRWRARSWLRQNALSILGEYRRLHEIKHLAQSEYARSFLYAQENILATILSDWTRDIHSQQPTPELRRFVAYNPAKGGSAAAALERRMPDLPFLPLVGMDHEAVMESLQRSLVYIDLGHHPGKDRLPREAAACGAVTIVARRGAGAFYQDVPLPWGHKVAPAPDIVADAERALREVLANPRLAWEEQAPYRQMISQERETFTSQVRDIFIDRHLD